MIDQKIITSEPLWAEYLRGYHRGIQDHFLGVSDKKTDEHSLLIDRSGCSSGDPYIDSYSRGYRHGFEGKTPESHPLLSSSFSSSIALHIASIV